METIYSEPCHIKNASVQICHIWKEKYQLSDLQANQVIEKVITPYLRELKDDLYCIIEYPYIDKMFRDTFYHYYSSKLELIPRNSIRISFFDTEIKKEDFQNEETIKRFQSNNNYLGFLTLRPTFPNVIGRSGISPNAKKNSNFLCCKTKLDVTVNHIRFRVKCFPHSSQDNQTITCAETTIWSLFEYLGNRYPEYKPIYPSTIHEILQKYSYKRLMPSEGLTAEQVTFAVRELGMGAMIYSRNKHAEDFDTLISTYVESGIPLITVLSNKDKTIGHAVNIIGRQHIDCKSVTIINPEQVTCESGNYINVIDFNKIPLEYVFIDDNHCPYQQASLANPCKNYLDEKWHNCIINNIIVPLYPKIYLEAARARHNFLKYLINSKIGIKGAETIIIKLFLASSRSYKEYLALNKSMNPDIKALFLSRVMSKFIWVGEVSKSTSYERGLCDGIILQDATEPLKSTNDTLFDKASLIAGYLNTMYFTQQSGKFQTVELGATSFESYRNNIK
jgi:hypothetical protein